MLNDIITLLQDAQRYFEHCGMYGYVIDTIEVESHCCVNMTIRESTPMCKLGEPFVLAFSNGDGLSVKNANTLQDMFDFSKENGWDDSIIHYIRYGNTKGNIDTQK